MARDGRAEALTGLLSAADQPAVEELVTLVDRVGLVDPAYAATRVAGFQPPKPRALVVERSKTARAILRQALDPLFEVIEVGDADTARRTIEDGPIALVVSQQLLPGGATGIELCQELRAQPDCERLPFVLVASDTSSDLEQRAKAAGVSAVMTKSDPAKMVRVIRELAARVTGSGSNDDSDTGI